MRPSPTPWVFCFVNSLICQRLLWDPPSPPAVQSSSLTCGDGAHDRLRGHRAVNCHQIHDVLGGWLQAHQDSVPLGGIQGNLHHLFLFIPGAVVQDESVRRRGWVTPGDVHTGGGHVRKVQMRDGAEACKAEEMDGSETHVRWWGRWARRAICLKGSAFLANEDHTPTL